MRSLPCSTATRVVLLLVLFLALAAPQCMAQAAASDTSTANFLATLSAAPAGHSSPQAPAPVQLSGCTSNAQCPTGQLCCLACGFPDCDRHACFTPMNGHCPFFP